MIFSSYRGQKLFEVRIQGYKVGPRGQKEVSVADAFVQEQGRPCHGRLKMMDVSPPFADWPWLDGKKAGLLMQEI